MGYPWLKNEFGESLEETLIREIKEETWLNVDIKNFVAKVISKFYYHEEYYQHTLLFCYVCKFISWETHLNDPKIKDIKRINLKSNFNDFDFLETTSEFLKFYLQNK